MQKCCVCQLELNEENAYKKYDKKRNASLMNYCKKCFSKYTVERYISRKLQAIEYMGGKCKECGYNKCYSALEFHHLDPTIKEGEWSQMRKWKWERVILELDKCILVCANCHREIHSEMVNREGIEPSALGLRDPCSTVELPVH